MPLSWFDRKNQDSSEWTGFLDKGVRFEGKLEVAGTFRLDAAVKGTLVSTETLILGDHSSMEGTIEGKAVIIGGRFDGIITPGAGSKFRRGRSSRVRFTLRA
jgi:cytoskeletal protein CcmA (bactofilin family)